MRSPSNLPPGGGFYRPPEMVKQKCPNGHVWETAMFFELGGWFYSDEDQGPICPECGAEVDVEASKDLE